MGYAAPAEAQTTTRLATSVVVVWFAVALLFVYFVFFGGAPGYLSFPQIRALTHLLTLTTALVILAAALMGKLSLRSPLVLPGLAWIGATALATLTSARPEMSREALAILLVSFPAYFGIRAVVWSESLRSRTQWLLIASATALVVLYLGQVLTQWIGWWSAVGISLPPLRPGNVSLTLSSVNTVALYLELLLPIAVWFSWTRWRSRAFSVALAVLALVSLLITGSRGAWLGIGAGAVVLACLATPSSWIRHIQSRMRAVPRLVTAVIGVLIGVTIVAGSLFLIDRAAANDAGRSELWSAALAMGSRAPILGVGPAAWSGLRPLEYIATANHAVVHNAHNAMLQTFVDVGLLGLLAGAWLLLAIGALAYRSISRATGRTDRITRAIAVASLVAAGIHSLVDTQFQTPGVAILVMILVAHLDEPAVAADRSGISDRSRALMATAGVLIGAVLLIPIDVAMLRAGEGDRLLNAGQSDQALVEYEAAIALHDLPVYRLGEAIARSNLGDTQGTVDALERVVDREALSFEQAQLALASLENGDVATARILAHAVVENGYDPAATLGAAVVLARLGDDAASTTALADVMARVPSLVYSERPADLFDAPIWDAAQRAALDGISKSDPVRAAALSMRAGLDDLTPTYAGAVPGGPEREMLSVLDAAVTTGSTDLDRARSILRANPESQALLNLHWDLAFAAGSQEDADLVTAIAIPLLFETPQLPEEIVTAGRSDSDYSLRLPRYPESASFRTGPSRIYIDGYPTIEPVFRP